MHGDMYGELKRKRRAAEASDEPAAGKEQPAARSSRFRSNGIPERLRAGIEAMSGVSLEGARVHFNSSRPAQVNALAMAIDREIHLGPGQEQHLPHEAWHLVQQSKEEVAPTSQVGSTAINTSPALEKAADRFGGMALRDGAPRPAVGELAPLRGPARPVAQLVVTPGFFGSWVSSHPDLENSTFRTKEAAEEAERKAEARPPREDKKRRRLPQTHLDGRPDAPKGTPQLAVKELHDKVFGRGVSAAESSRGGFKKKYRQTQAQHYEGGSGAGLDERVSTATTADLRPLIASKFGADEVHPAVGSLSEARDHVEHLLWTDPDDEAQPLNAHPGGLTKKEGDGRLGVTHGHSTRDSDRARWVDNELRKGVASGGSLPQILKRTKLASNIKTVAGMSQPYSQLNTVDPAEAIDTYHPRHGAVIEGGELRPGFKSAISDAHNNREFTKIQTASQLVEEGLGNLVDDDMLALLAKHDNDPDAAHKLRSEAQAPGTTDIGPPATQTKLPADPKTLEELSAENKVTPGLHRTISAPRLLARPGYV